MLTWLNISFLFLAVFVGTPQSAKQVILTCGNDSSDESSIPGPRGIPGKRGPAGPVGPRGPRGHKGEPAESPNVHTLQAKVARLEAELNHTQVTLQAHVGKLETIKKR